MEKKNNIKKIIALIICAFVFISSMVILFFGMVLGYDSFSGVFKGEFNISYIKYFTTLSNVVNGFVCLNFFILLLRHFKEDKIYPKHTKLILLTSTTNVMLTFLTVVFFLTPTFTAQGYSLFAMYKNDLFFYHFFNPVITLVLYLFFFKGKKLNFKCCFYSIIPMALYGIVYSSCVISGVWEDFYGFTFGGHYLLALIVFPIMLGVTYLIAFLINFASNKLEK